MNANSDKDYIDAKTAAIRASLEGRLDTFEANMNGQFAASREIVNGQFAVVDQRFAAVYERLDAVDAHFDQLRAEINSAVDRAMTQMLKWTAGFFLAMATIFFSSMAFFMNTVAAKISAQPAPTPPPAVMHLTTPAAPPESVAQLRSASNER